MSERISVGSRVRVLPGKGNAESYVGKEGVITLDDGTQEYPYRVKFDDMPDGGVWPYDSFEVLTIPQSAIAELQAQIDALTEKYAKAINIKDGALMIAAAAFEQYARNHYDKLTPESTIKAITNVGLAELMNDALEAD